MTPDVEAYIAALVEQAPPLTNEQAARITRDFGTTQPTDVDTTPEAARPAA